MNRLCPAETRLKEGACALNSDQTGGSIFLAAGWWRPVSALPAVSSDGGVDVKRGRHSLPRVLPLARRVCPLCRAICIALQPHDAAGEVLRRDRDV
jgi:hypothetical protein